MSMEAEEHVEAPDTQPIERVTEASDEGPTAASLKREWLLSYEKLIDKALALNCNYEVGLKSIAANNKVYSSNNPVSGLVAMYQGVNRLVRKRSKIHVQPSAVQRRAGASRSTRAQKSGRPRQQEGGVVKKKRKRNLATAVRANKANAISH